MPGSLEFVSLQPQINTFDGHHLWLINMATIFPSIRKEFRYRPLLTPAVCGWFHAPDGMIMVLDDESVQLMLNRHFSSLLINDVSITFMEKNGQFGTIELEKIKDVFEYYS